MDPATFYEPPTSMRDKADRKECVECHADESPVWVQAWERSTHANLDKVRASKAERPDLLQERQA